MIRPLRAKHVCRYGVPVVWSVDTRIFSARYFTHCMQCSFCHDRCCAYGVDVDVENVSRILAKADAIEAFVGIPRERWFSGEWDEDPEFPGGRFTRTAVEDDLCVFTNRKGRGCLLHSFALERGLDYHDIKPMVSTLFPVTFDSGQLQAAQEVLDRDLVCFGAGPTVYRGVRDELAYYFGPALVAELDAIEADTRAGAA